MSVQPVYYFDMRDYGKSSSGFDKTGPYRATFLIESIFDLRKNLQAKGSVVVRVGRPETVLLELAKAICLDVVYAHREISHDEVKGEEKIESIMKEKNVEVKYFWGSTLYHVDDLPFKLEEMPTNYRGFREKVQGLNVKKMIEALDRIKGLSSRGDVEARDILSLVDLGLNPSATMAQQAGGISSQTQKIFMENTPPTKLRILCLHGFRTSGKILEKMIGRWQEKVIGKLNLVFLDGPFLARGKSDVEGIFDPPYYEWFQSNQDFSEFTKFEECVDYIEAFMVKNGPFDGFLGFSQGATLAATLPGMQAKCVALQKVGEIKVLILISAAKMGGSKFGVPKLATNAFSSPIHCPSLHFIGENDFLREESKVLLKSFVDPVVIHHKKGHTVPRLDEEQEVLLNFIEKISAKL